MMKLSPGWGNSLLSAGCACVAGFFFLLIFSANATAMGLSSRSAGTAGTGLRPLLPPLHTVYSYTYQYTNSSGASVAVTLPYTLSTYYTPPYTATTATWDFSLYFDQGQYQAVFGVREREGSMNVHGAVLREIMVTIHCESVGGVQISGNQADFQAGFLRCFVPRSVSYQALAGRFFGKPVANSCSCHSPFVEVTAMVRSVGENPFVYVDAGQPHPELESYLLMSNSQASVHFAVAKEQYQSDIFTPAWITMPDTYDILRSAHITATAVVEHYQQNTLIGRQPALKDFSMQTGAMTFYVGMRPAALPFSPTWLDGSLQGVRVDPGCKGH